MRSNLARVFPSYHETDERTPTPDEIAEMMKPSSVEYSQSLADFARKLDNVLGGELTSDNPRKIGCCK